MSLSYTFDATVEGWADQGGTTDPATLSWDSGTGSPDNGSVKVVMPAGGGAGNPNGATSVRVTFAETAASIGAAASFRYRINNTGTSRTFTIIYSTSDSTITTVTPTESGDSGWVTVNDTFSSDGSFVYLDISFDSNNFVGDYTFYIDTVTAASQQATLTHSATGIPGGILIA